jgi:Tfp pilus assembly PilM family ATPase
MAGIGIEVGYKSLRLARLASSSQGVQLLDVWEFFLPGNEEDRWSLATATELRAQCKKRKFNMEKAVIAVAGASLNLRYLRLPRLSTLRLRQTLELEVAQIREKNSAELAYGYLPLVLGDDKSAQEQLVVLALMHNQLLDRLYTFFRAAGVRIRCFVPSSLGLYTAFAHLSDYRQESCYLAHFDTSHINLAIAQNGQLCFLRNTDWQHLVNQSIPKDPLGQLAEETAKKPSDDIFNEPLNSDEDEEEAEDIQKMAGRAAPDFLEASLKLARLQCKIADLQVERMLCAGDGATQKDFCLLLASRFHCSGQPMLLGTKVASRLENDAAKFFEKNPSRFMVALGLAYLANQPGEVPLTIASLTQQTWEAQLRRVLECVSLAIAVCGALVAVGISFNARKFQENQYEQWQQKYTKLQEKAARLEKVEQEGRLNEAKLAMLYQNILPNRRFLEIASWLYGHLPTPMYLTQLKWEVSKDNKIKIVLMAVIEESSQDAYAILGESREALEKSSLFRISEEKDPKFDEAEGRLHIEFRLIAPIIR